MMAATDTVLGAFLVLTAGAAVAQSPHVNVTAGGPLRPGVYGRIELGPAPPPRLFAAKPVVASKALGPPRQQPIYLYVPPGQVRKWARHCERYQACERPVYFVRMDNTPGKLGRWKARSQPQDREATRVASGAGPGF